MKTIVKALIVYKELSAHAHMLVLTRAAHVLSFPGMGDLPGGGVLAGETFETAIKRELYEETQLVVDVPLEHICSYCWQNAGTEYEEHLFLGYVTTQVVVINPDEHSSFSWVPLSELEATTLHPSIKKIIAELPIISFLKRA